MGRSYGIGLLWRDAIPFRPGAAGSACGGVLDPR